ncbi:Glucosamine-6-phosphate isomerase (Glucosamine-6-phosphate deaminase) (GNPDA) (GlcN6P deaminase) [Cladophialophora chaetospira]|uniref:Beta-hexosaminidase n=1 Tax=Cladophialophora chaetospira TaxID=386627 RepID=A0AA38X7E7_9EURO|nr:Glucosamine-6-phosphate isomerase (Glucosamine-6-phosphate deaminase) (GNPDA) (GlcN6P deaminase) [Cladophialophora chaetospira]
MFARACVVALGFVFTLCAAVWPQPAEIRTGSRVLWLDQAVDVALRCGSDGKLQEDAYTIHHGNNLRRLFGDIYHYAQGAADTFQSIFKDRDRDGHINFSESSIVKEAVTSTIKEIHGSKFVPWKLHKRNADFEPDSSAPQHYLSTLQIHQSKCPGSQALQPASFFAGDESHEVIIESNGTAVIKSNSSIGTIRGLQTLRQLFFAHSTSSQAYTPFVPLRIADHPKWPYRGLSIDIARNAFEPRDLLRTIDAMALAKMSRLHIHATDSQSWPIEIPSFPELARKGAYRPELVWSVASLRDIQMYGASRGVSVFVEIDIPGHTASIAHAFPNLIAAFNEKDWSTFAAEPLSGQLKLNDSNVDSFITILLHDLLPRTSPYTSLYHVGGDEVNLAAYLLDETVKSDSPEVLKPLLQNFIDHVVTTSISLGLQPIIWEELLLDWDLTMPTPDPSNPITQTLVQVWRDSARIEEVLQRGHRAIFGDHHYWYLDCGYGGFLDPYPGGKSPSGVPYNSSGGRPSKLHEPFLDYCAPYHNWRQMFTYNPLANISSDLHDGIEGGEVLMWSEQTDSQDLDSKLWPRVAAAAEVLWAGVREAWMLEDATKRLGEWRERVVVDLGIRASPVTMTWCLMEGGCNL